MAGRADSAGRGNGGNNGAAAFRVQNQIRRNAQDMQEYLADLGSWEKSIKRKDKQLTRKAAAAAGTPSIRRSEATVSVSSGPAPQAPVEKKKKREERSSSEHRKGSQERREDHSDARASLPHGGCAKIVEQERLATSPVSAAGHTHDKGYGKWNRFDIDAALRSVDEEDGTHGGSKKQASNSVSDSDTDSDGNDGAARTPYLTPATMVDRSRGKGIRPAPVARPSPPPPPPVPPIDREKEEREKGNAKFGRGDFEGAVKSYTRCVGINSKSLLAFSNRAMAYLKLKEFGKAEADGDAALRLGPRHVKSLQRRAAARNALGKHRAALADLQTAVEIDPSSKQVRKDLSKTHETLKTVVRRAPKTRVKVESAPLPAPKPRDYSPPVNVSAGRIDSKASPAFVEGTTAPVSSVSRENSGSCSLGDAGIPKKRVSVEEPTDDTEAPPSCSLSGSLLANPLMAPSTVLPPGRVSAFESEDPLHETESLPKTAPSCSLWTRGARDTAVIYAPAPETASSAEGDLTPGPATAGPSGADQPAAVTPPHADATDLAFVPTSRKVEVRSVDYASVAAGAKEADTALVADSGAPVEDHPAAGKADAQSLAKKETKKKTAPSQHTTTPSAAAVAAAPGGLAPVLQLPTTGYQFERLWRSTEGSPKARLELLRTIPPSSLSKIFRRTPLEVELLDGILERLEEALLPRRPVTALRWLKGLSKASRFGMTVALLGEGSGRAASRELLVRLEAAPSSKVNPEDVEALRKLYLC